MAEGKEKPPSLTPHDWSTFVESKITSQFLVNGVIPEHCLSLSHAECGIVTDLHLNLNFSFNFKINSRFKMLYYLLNSRENLLGTKHNDTGDVPSKYLPTFFICTKSSTNFILTHTGPQWSVLHMTFYQTL
jgi:hypothetical protein